MEIAMGGVHNAVMDITEDDPIFELAVQLAYRTFTLVTDEHIEWICARLVTNATYGLAADGAVTVH